MHHILAYERGVFDLTFTDEADGKIIEEKYPSCKKSNATFNITQGAHLRLRPGTKFSHCFDFFFCGLVA